MMFTGKARIAAVILAALTLVGAGCYVYQLAGGLGVTGMNNSTSWGLYIAMFMFFVGLSAGGLIVASSAHVFNIESFKKVSIPAIITSIVCICVAGLFILIDLGGLYSDLALVHGSQPDLAALLGRMRDHRVPGDQHSRPVLARQGRGTQGRRPVARRAAGCHPGALCHRLDFRPADCQGMVYRDHGAHLRGIRLRFRPGAAAHLPGGAGQGGPVPLRLLAHEVPGRAVRGLHRSRCVLHRL